MKKKKREREKYKLPTSGMKERTSLEVPGIKGIIKEYCANKFNNLDEMHKFLERY